MADFEKVQLQVEVVRTQLDSLIKDVNNLKAQKLNFTVDSSGLEAINRFNSSVQAITQNVDGLSGKFTCIWAGAADGALFTVAKIGGAGYITLHGSEGEEIGAPVMGRGNCGVGLDGRFFKIVNGAVTLQNGFVLTVNATPNDAIITVTDAEGETVDPVSGNAKQFLLKGIGDTYTVTSTKAGYTTEAKQVKNTGDQTFTIVMKAAA